MIGLARFSSRPVRWSRAAWIAASVSLFVAACAPSTQAPAATTAPAAPAAAKPTTAAAAPTAAPAVAAKPAASGATGTVNVAMVGNPQMKTLEQLKGDFESSHPGITLNLLVLPENQVRDKVTTDISTNAAQFDLVTIGMYEVPLWAKNGWIEEVGTTLQADANYDYNDLIPSIRKGLEYDGKLYAAPFYGESSALFYRKDILQKANVTMPDKPTWDQVAAAAKAVHNPPNQFGICLRGLPGWGEQLAPLDTVINTFGRTAGGESGLRTGAGIRSGLSLSPSVERMGRQSHPVVPGRSRPADARARRAAGRAGSESTGASALAS